MDFDALNLSLDGECYFVEDGGYAFTVRAEPTPDNFGYQGIMAMRETQCAVGGVASSLVLFVSSAWLV